ncbi:MAG: hypothetical protein KKA84_12565 [Bacteroidetes bacterium]|nr:hypothetical protein [Bacteroidota bacterium]
MYKYLAISILFLMHLNAQDINESTATFFDDCKTTEYALGNITVCGEVETEISIELSTLPLRSFPFKEVKQISTDKKRFIGSYFVTGYSLYDIIANVKIKKVNEEEFRPPVDIYVIVENEEGEKAVFSWGELFYSKDNFKSIITKSIAPINPSKGKMEWPVSESTRLICGYDMTNERFISNPTKITLKSAPGEYSKERMENIFSSEIKVIKDDTEIAITEIGDKIRKISFEHIGYGHGRGFKGISQKEGFLLKDILNNVLTFYSNDLRSSLLIVSAKDGYRVTYSLAEIINRNDLEDFLLFDCGEATDAGRFTSFTTADFFVDRNVRSIEKIEIIEIK